MTELRSRLTKWVFSRYGAVMSIRPTHLSAQKATDDDPVTKALNELQDRLGDKYRVTIIAHSADSSVEDILVTNETGGWKSTLLAVAKLL